MKHAEKIQLAPGELWFNQHYLDGETADHFLHQLLTEIEWQQGRVRLFGKPQKTPRLQYFMGDKEVSYSYSGERLITHPWHPTVALLAERLLADTGYRFNSVLLNLYRDGNDSMGWHSDDEPELGQNPQIASISLGTERRFLLRRKMRTKNERSVGINLSHGSLLWMGSGIQTCWQHSLPKTRACPKPRINLTFRQILVPNTETS
ncbi:alpha-ketoglutarate-dependent dioxygenase AlkB family protein [Pontibacter sp. JAM-7]|uniref:alpha-ketoglutarate-dependent dioxygenase AlkB family protein n=1 Tax=Pontibacter sp. JAM-7 TaxID=3366581 RepID=UPI003AF4E3D8